MCLRNATTRVAGILDVHIIQANGIRNICPYGQQDVYAKILCGQRDPLSRVSLHTRTVKEGGSSPVFNQRLQIGVPGGETEVKCEIWVASHNRGTADDQLLGFAHIPIGGKLLEREKSGPIAFELTEAQDEESAGSAGCIKMTLSYHARGTQASSLSGGSGQASRGPSNGSSLSKALAGALSTSLSNSSRGSKRSSPEESMDVSSNRSGQFYDESEVQSPGTVKRSRLCPLGGGFGVGVGVELKQLANNETSEERKWRPGGPLLKLGSLCLPDIDIELDRDASQPSGLRRSPSPSSVPAGHQSPPPAERKSPEPLSLWTASNPEGSLSPRCWDTDGRRDVWAGRAGSFGSAPLSYELGKDGRSRRERVQKGESAQLLRSASQELEASAEGCSFEREEGGMELGVVEWEASKKAQSNSVGRIGQAGGPTMLINSTQLSVQSCLQLPDDEGPSLEQIPAAKNSDRVLPSDEGCAQTSNLDQAERQPFARPIWDRVAVPDPWSASSSSGMALGRSMSTPSTARSVWAFPSLTDMGADETAAQILELPPLDAPSPSIQGAAESRLDAAGVHEGAYLEPTPRQQLLLWGRRLQLQEQETLRLQQQRKQQLWLQQQKHRKRLLEAATLNCKNVLPSSKSASRTDPPPSQPLSLLEQFSQRQEQQRQGKGQRQLAQQREIEQLEGRLGMAMFPPPINEAIERKQQQQGQNPSERKSSAEEPMQMGSQEALLGGAVNETTEGGEFKTLGQFHRFMSDLTLLPEMSDEEGSQNARHQDLQAPATGLQRAATSVFPRLQQQEKAAGDGEDFGLVRSKTALF